MNTKRILAVLALTILAAVAWANDDDPAGRLESRSFKLSHKSPERAAVVIRPLVSAEGSISIQPATNTLVITDRPENLRSMTQALADFDAPPRTFRVELKMVAASRASGTPRIPEDLRDVSTKLGAVLRFNSFEKLGEFTAEGDEGDNLANVQVGEAYRADLTFGEYDPVSGALRLQDLTISKTQPATEGASAVAPLLKRTSLNLKIGQTLILGAQRVPESNRALMLIVVASRVE